MKKRLEKMKYSALICPGGLYEEAVLIYLFDDTHICISCLQNIPKFPIATEIIGLRNRILPFENVSKSPFFSFISLSGFRACRICLVGGYKPSRVQIFECTLFSVLLTVTKKLTWPRSLPILNTCLLIFMVKLVECLMRLGYFAHVL